MPVFFLGSSQLGEQSNLGMADLNIYQRVRSVYAVGRLVQLKAGLGRVGRARVGNVTGHQGATVVVKFISDPTRSLSCDPSDLEDPHPAFLEENPMNVLSDTIEELRVRFLELHSTRFQVEADEEEVLALYNRSATAYNKLVRKNSSDVEYDTYRLISPDAPVEVVGRCEERLGRLSAAKDDNSKPIAEGSDAGLVAGDCALGGSRSAREVLSEAVAKLTRCTNVLSNLVDRFDLDGEECIIKPDESKQKTVCAYAQDVGRASE